MSRILVVDDESEVRDFLRFALIGAGHAVTTAGDGLEAIEKAGGFDMLLTDLMMPRMAGDELAQRMRQRDPDLRVLYLTGYTDRLFAEKQMLWEGEAFLEKPASAAAVLEAIDLLMNGDTLRAG
jgi:CheY-like chemotaxis protein